MTDLQIVTGPNPEPLTAFAAAELARYARDLFGVDDEETLNQARARIENYINRMWNYYHEMLTRIGWADEVRAVQQAWAETRDRQQAMAGISDRMIRENEVVGTMPEVQERLRERAENGADLQIIYMPKGDAAEAGRLLEAFISA